MGSAIFFKATNLLCFLLLCDKTKWTNMFCSCWLVKREHNWLLWGRSLQSSVRVRVREKASQKIRAKGGVARKKRARAARGKTTTVIAFPTERKLGSSNKIQPYNKSSAQRGKKERNPQTIFLWLSPFYRMERLKIHSQYLLNIQNTKYKLLQVTNYGAVYRVVLFRNQRGS